MSKTFVSIWPTRNVACITIESPLRSSTAFVQPLGERRMDEELNAVGQQRESGAHQPASVTRSFRFSKSTPFFSHQSLSRWGRENTRMPSPFLKRCAPPSGGVFASSS